MIAKHVFYEGRVQGVGFRYSLRNIAKGYNVIGWARNLVDGRVEVLVGGELAEVTGFLEAVAESELAGFIKGVEAATVSGAALSGVHGFQIVM